MEIDIENHLSNLNRIFALSVYIQKQNNTPSEGVIIYLIAKYA